MSWYFIDQRKWKRWQICLLYLYGDEKRCHDAVTFLYQMARVMGRFSRGLIDGRNGRIGLRWHTMMRRQTGMTAIATILKMRWNRIRKLRHQVNQPQTSQVETYLCLPEASKSWAAHRHDQTSQPSWRQRALLYCTYRENITQEDKRHDINLEACLKHIGTSPSATKHRGRQSIHRHCLYMAGRPGDLG